MVKNCSSYTDREFKLSHAYYISMLVLQYQPTEGTSCHRLITLFQVLWFVARCIMRAANLLPLAQLESMTLSYIPLFAVMYFFYSVQLKSFKFMALSKKFDNVNTQKSYWNIWDLTPRQREAASQQQGTPKSPTSCKTKMRAMGSKIRAQKDTVLAHLDPYLYRSKIISALCSLFGASFGAIISTVIEPGNLTRRE
ncbi:hypothetical protein BDW60DRAFT_226038 [Aspergillus nidulans var. acristatus]